ncbi:MAG TPA: ankyrin repeat domain-containing protein [Chloroflexaceae bacterium]|nr:ankyrin repeat domain-containing protein [Chloroflexaceae bacterium]
MRTNRRHPIPRPLAWLAFAAATVFLLFSQDLIPGNRRLYDAIEEGDVGAARRLLDDGADPNSSWRGFDHVRTDRYFFKPLPYALWRGEPEIARLLVEGGADPNVRSPKGEPALILAASAGHVELVRALLAHGADPNISMPSGETALRWGGPLRGMLKEELDPEVRALLEAGGAR